MQYRQIPKTGDRLSILGFGCMRLPQKKGQPGDGRIDKKRATCQIQRAVEQGVNYLDTAMPYHMGGSEGFLGEALGNGMREQVRLATKLPPWQVREHADMDRLLGAQLDRLHTDRIDYYLLHALAADNWHKLRRLDVLSFLERAKKAGRIVHAGFSFHGDPDTFREIVDAYDWEFCQIQYNFLDEANQAGTAGLKYAAEKNLGVMVMEPLRGGNLAGRVPPEVAALWNRAQVKRTPAEWALRWVWNHPEVTVVLSGMNEEAHIEENIQAAENGFADSLTQDELSLFSDVEQTYRRLMKAGCTGCRYCMPCPAGVDIPDCFELYNNFHMFHDKKTARLVYIARLYGVLTSIPAQASLCQHCGQCESKCPQHLPIQQLLEDVVQTFEIRRQKIMAWVMGQFFNLQRRGSIRRAKRAAAKQTRCAQHRKPTQF
jgi:predicted aldo/keto reductase-like oxidoreductase